MAQTKAQLVDISTTGISAGSASTPGITFTGDLNTGIYSPGADQVAISTNGTGRLFVDSSGRVLVGTSSASKNADRLTGNKIALVGTAQYPSLVVTGYGADGDFGPVIDLQNSRGASDGSMTVVNNNDRLGGLTFLGSDGTNFIRGATISGFVDGTPGANDMPGRIVLSTTADGASSPTERMRIDSSGRVGIGTTSPNGTLTVEASSGRLLTFRNPTTGTGASDGSYIALGGSDLQISNAESASTIFYTADTERARIDSSGRLLVGTSSSNGGQLEVNRASNNSSLAGVLGFPQFSITNSFGYGYPAGMLFKAPLEPSGPIVNNAAIWSEWTSNNNAYLGFATNNGGTVTEGMRIDSSSRLLVGKTSPVDTNARISVRNTTAGGIAIESDNSGTFGIRIYNATTGASQTSVGFLTTGGASMGAITNNNSTVTYSSASDYRLKENVSTITNAISRLQQLKPSRFNFISTPGATVDGFIAHEVQAIVPEAITGEKDAVDDDGNPIYQGIDQSKLVPLLTAALQEAVAKIEALEARLTAAGID